MQKTRSKGRSRGRRDGGGFKRPSRLLKPDQEVDYKDYELLRRFVTERGKIMPRRSTGVSAKQQRQVKRAILRARVMGLLP